MIHIRVTVAKLLRRRPALQTGERATNESRCLLVCVQMAAMSSAHMSMLTNRSQFKHNTPCTGFHSPLLRARPALKLQTFIRQNAAVRTGVDGYKLQISCQHGRQPMRRLASTHRQVRVEEDTLEPVPAWRKVVSFLLKSSAVVALALTLVSLKASPAQFVKVWSLCNSDIHMHRRPLDQYRLLRPPVVVVAWEAQASVLQDQALAPIAGRA